MKMIIIKIVVVIVAIVSIALVVSMFTKKEYTLTREIIINKPSQAVFDFIKYNRNQPKYSVWLSFDPNTKIEFKGTADGTPGSILCFESSNKKTGKGEWETKNITEGEKVEFELRFLAPFEFTANGYLQMETIAANQTKLTWVYNSGMKWPANFMLIFMDMDKIIGTDMMTSLTSIKSIVEK